MALEIEQEDRVHDVLAHPAIPLLDLPLPLPHAPVFEGADDGGAQPREAVLQEIVGGAPLHAFNRRLLGDGAGDDDERDIQRALLQELQGAGGVEHGQMVVGQDDVDVRSQIGEKLALALHPLPVGVESRSPELVEHELGISLEIFQDQHLERGGHRSFRFSGPEPREAG